MKPRSGDFYRPEDPFQNVLEHYYRLNAPDSSCESWFTGEMIRLYANYGEASQTRLSHRAPPDGFREPSGTIPPSAYSTHAYPQPGGELTGRQSSYTLPFRLFRPRSRSPVPHPWLITGSPVITPSSKASACDLFC